MMRVTGLFRLSVAVVFLNLLDGSEGSIALSRGHYFILCSNCAVCFLIVLIFVMRLAALLRGISRRNFFGRLTLLLSVAPLPAATFFACLPASSLPSISSWLGIHLIVRLVLECFFIT